MFMFCVGEKHGLFNISCKLIYICHIVVTLYNALQADRYLVTTWLMDPKDRGAGTPVGLSPGHNLSSMSMVQQQGQAATYVRSPSVSSSQMSAGSTQAGLHMTAECSGSSPSSARPSPQFTGSVLSVSGMSSSVSLAAASQSQDDDCSSSSSSSMYGMPSPSTSCGQTQQTLSKSSANLGDGPTSTQRHGSKNSSSFGKLLTFLCSKRLIIHVLVIISKDHDPVLCW